MATIHQRDEDINVLPHPDTVSEYTRAALERAQARLTELEHYTPEQAEQAAEAEYQEQVTHREAMRQRDAELAQRYGQMLQQVRDWQPPTPEHEPLKAFMIEQLENSIKHDAGLASYTTKPERQPGAVWLHQKMADAHESVVRESRRLAEEEERVTQRNAWIAALYASLEPSAVTTH
jgi:hypothetical protein